MLGDPSCTRHCAAPSGRTGTHRNTVKLPRGSKAEVRGPHRAAVVCEVRQTASLEKVNCKEAFLTGMTDRIKTPPPVRDSTPMLLTPGRRQLDGPQIPANISSEKDYFHPQLQPRPG